MNNVPLTMTVSEMMKAIPVSRTKAYELVHSKDFYPAVFIGGKILINREALMRWLMAAKRQGRDWLGGILSERGSNAA